MGLCRLLMVSPRWRGRTSSCCIRPRQFSCSAVASLSRSASRRPAALDRVIISIDGGLSPDSCRLGRMPVTAALGQDPTLRRGRASEYAVNLGGHDEVVLMQSLDLLGRKETVALPQPKLIFG